MELKTSIKQHDFISGEPRHKYFVFGNYDFSDVRILPTMVQLRRERRRQEELRVSIEEMTEFYRRY